MNTRRILALAALLAAALPAAGKVVGHVPTNGPDGMAWAVLR